MQVPPVPPPPPSSPPPPPPRLRTVPWDGRDLAITLFAGGGIGLFLIVGLLVPITLAEATLSAPLELLIASLAVYGTMCLFGWWFCIKRHGATLANAGFKWVGIGPLLLMIPAAIGMMLVIGFLSYLTSLVIGEVPTAQEQLIPEQNTLPLIDFIWLMVAGAIAAPIAEEFLFRGLFYRYLRARRRLWVAILVSSVAFAVAHFVPVSIPVLIVFGIAEALVAERYDSLYPAMMLHALNNGTIFVVMYLTLN